ncbi:hypothetical protein BJF79_24170 [Actinomadura sp. CNU-125]|uniref:hypothetical protein n=1 Tax=Actinomadura sp. CNU-125 TaxID=1904961 RepID=UPI0009697CF8|nr:hypothetical protein [Actinomadura sp. CNU-125]OLT11428.1 hypothetical protein BJF79_24170 [Actinomadura sp. CNU-125]
MDQRTVYWKFAAWRYRNPEANEPSDTALAMNRFAMFFIAAVFAVIGGMVIASDGTRTYGSSAAEVRAVADAAAESLRRDATPGLGPTLTESAVIDAVAAEGDGEVRVENVPGDGDRYELTNGAGENPVCLTVEVDEELDVADTDREPWSHTISASVTDGPC